MGKWWQGKSNLLCTLLLIVLTNDLDFVVSNPIYISSTFQPRGSIYCCKKYDTVLICIQLEWRCQLPQQEQGCLNCNGGAKLIVSTGDPLWQTPCTCSLEFELTVLVNVLVIPDGLCPVKSVFGTVTQAIPPFITCNTPRVPHHVSWCD